MKSLVYIFLLVQFQCIFGQTVEELVQDIEDVEEQALNWTYPTNSYSYIIDNYSPGSYEDIGVYDFIVVGSGSSGSVLANRLSEVAGWNILLIEAGGWENDTSDIPDMTDYLRTTDFNWGYYTNPLPDYLQGYIDNSIPFPRGKAIGGTSVINAMIYARGNPADFNLWGEDNPGWSYDDILPYFKKSEIVSFPHASPTYHGRNGTLHVEYSRIYDEVGEAFLQAQNELGRKVVTDYNGEDQMTFSIVQLTEDEGRRDSTGKAFINPAKNRTNLKILTDTLVTKLLIHKNNRTVYGVQFASNGTFSYATVSKEVILSAGTINTAQLLMLSGIGPKEHLSDFGIEVIKDLPVGDNLWDHLIYSYQSFGINYTYPSYNTTTLVEQYLNAKGTLTTADDLQCLGYVNLLNTSKTVPDVEHVFHASKSGERPYTQYKNLFGFTEESYNDIIIPTVNKSQVSIHSVLLHPKSRGTIRLKSASPFDYPEINPNYFSHPEDADILVAAVKDQFRIMSTSAMQHYNATPIQVCHPHCNCSDYGSDDFWRCMVETVTGTVYHYSGTAKMGPKCNTDSVVDASLRVHGVKNLRVADCSVVPVTTSGHTNAVAIMIGEKAADIIKGCYCDGVVCPEI